MGLFRWPTVFEPIWLCGWVLLKLWHLQSGLLFTFFFGNSIFIYCKISLKTTITVFPAPIMKIKFFALPFHFFFLFSSLECFWENPSVSQATHDSFQAGTLPEHSSRTLQKTVEKSASPFPWWWHTGWWGAVWGMWKMIPLVPHLFFFCFYIHNFSPFLELYLHQHPLILSFMTNFAPPTTIFIL